MNALKLAVWVAVAVTTTCGAAESRSNVGAVQVKEIKNFETLGDEFVVEYTALNHDRALKYALRQAGREASQAGKAKYVVTQVRFLAAGMPTGPVPIGEHYRSGASEGWANQVTARVYCRLVETGT